MSEIYGDTVAWFVINTVFLLTQAKNVRVLPFVK